MMIHCGKAAKRIGMLGISARNMKECGDGDSDTDWYR